MHKIFLSIFAMTVLFSEIKGQSMDYVFPEADLKAAAASHNTRYYEFIKNDALKSGIYTLKQGDTDEQKPHLLDELYYVLEGESQFSVAGNEYAVKEGDVIYVPAHVEHKFFAIRKDLRLLVFFSDVQRPKPDQ